MIEQAIIHRIMEAQKLKSSIIVAFCGAADLGKSFLANKVVQFLRNIAVDSQHLNLDAFLMDRAERKSENTSGYDIRAHNIRQILSALEGWRSGQAIRFRPYDHHSGTKSKNYLEIQHSNILLIEGLFSMYESFLPFIDLSFFFYTDYDKLKTIKLEADLTKRNYTPEYAQSIYDKEFDLYRRNIEPFKQQANFTLYLKNKWHYILQDNG